MLFTPLLAEAASGTLEPRHVVVPLRMMCPHAQLIVGRVTGIDTDRRTVAVDAIDGPLEIGYERLVVALGSVPRTLPVPGLAEHGHGFRDLADAISLRNHVLRELEAADAADTPEAVSRHLSFVFIGAGYAGVEALAELSDLVRDALRHYPRLRGTAQRWVLVDAAPKILPEIPTRLGEYAAVQLARRGVEIHVSTRLESADDRSVLLSDGTRIGTNTLVWTAGVRASPLLPELGLPLDERGRVVVDEYLRVVGRDGAWALGDCAAVPNLATPGQARNLTGDPKPYRYRMLGQVATLGRYKGIADVMGLRLRGFPGWFFTRTYHLYQLPLLSRKLRVVVDWTVALFFRRDIAELGALGHPRRLAPP
jgi:NADH dehydrogenase